jgi:hypothetical protein
MTGARDQFRLVLRRLWQADRPLTAVGLLMSGVLMVTVVGLLVDPRSIAGSPAWLKPAKFAVATAVYSLTLAWLFSLLPEWRRTRAVVGWTSAVVFVLENGIIDLQAWRGTTSHFNIGTPLDASLFAVMGIAIVVQTAASAAIAFALWRQRIDNAPLRAAVRAGMLITLLGAASGGLMTRPTGEQLVAARATGHIAVAGAHTVGAPDGGPGLPGTGWSREHGDLRVGHFVGLHALQVLPLLALLIARRRPSDVARRLVQVAASSYGALFLLLIVQALRGESIAGPGPLTAALFATWAAATVVGAWRSEHTSVPVHSSTAVEV